MSFLDWDSPERITQRHELQEELRGRRQKRRRLYDVLATCPQWKTQFELGYVLTVHVFESRTWAETYTCKKCGREHPPDALKLRLREHRERRKRQEIRLENQRARDALGKHSMLAGWLPWWLQTDEERAEPRLKLPLFAYLERHEPTRTRAVLEYIKFGEEHWPGNTYAAESHRGSEPSTAELKKHGGSPKEIQRRINQRKAKALPDPREREANRIVQHLRDVVRESHERPQEITEGATEVRVGAGRPPEEALLQIAAEHYVPQMQHEHKLLGEENRVALTQYLIGVWGALIRACPDPPTFCPACLEVYGGGQLCPRCEGELWQRLPGFEEWRSLSRQRLSTPSSKPRLLRSSRIVNTDDRTMVAG